MSIKIVKHWKVYLQHREEQTAQFVGTSMTPFAEIDQHGFIHFLHSDGEGRQAVALRELISYTLSPVYVEQEDGE